MSIDLTPFCSTDPLRPYLHQPWSRHGKTYATNGHILVRIPSREGDAPADKNSPDAERVFAAADAAAPLTPLPRYELPSSPVDKECDECKGRGHVHDCPDCECECDTCDGSGKTGLEGISVDFCGAILNAKYVRMLEKLPHIRVAVHREGPLEPLYFIFEGGDGVLMPMYSKMPIHIAQPDAAP